MEDIKWFIKKFGIIFVILLVMIVSTGIFYEKNARTSSAEEIWEMWLNGKDNIYEKAYLVHCTDQLPVMWMHKERYDIR